MGSFILAFAKDDPFGSNVGALLTKSFHIFFCVVWTDRTGAPLVSAVGGFAPPVLDGSAPPRPISSLFASLAQTGALLFPEFFFRVHAKSLACEIATCRIDINCYYV